MACEHLACLNENGCIERLDSGDPGQVLVINDDGLPEWVTRNTDLTIVGTVITYTRFDGTQAVFDTCADIVSKCPINALTDVDTSTVAPVVGQTLVWNGTNWVPGSGAINCASLNACSIDALGDVNTTTTPPIVGDALIWNGTAWVAGAPLVACPNITIASANDCTGGIGAAYAVRSVLFDQGTCTLTINSAPEHTTISGSFNQPVQVIEPMIAPITGTAQDLELTLTNPSLCRDMEYMFLLRPGRVSIVQETGNTWAINTTQTSDGPVPLGPGTMVRSDAGNGPRSDSWPEGVQMYRGTIGPGGTVTMGFTVEFDTTINFVPSPINRIQIGRSYIQYFGSTV